nr:hypothetical protein [Actinomycetota bacterium]
DCSGSVDGGGGGAGVAHWSQRGVRARRRFLATSGADGIPVVRVGRLLRVPSAALEDFMGTPISDLPRRPPKPRRRGHSRRSATVASTPSATNPSSLSPDTCSRQRRPLNSSSSTDKCPAPGSCRVAGKDVVRLSSVATARYYTQYLAQAPGEVPGEWTGRQATALELSGIVEADDLQVLVAHPPEVLSRFEDYDYRQLATIDRQLDAVDTCLAWAQGQSVAADQLTDAVGTLIDTASQAPHHSFDGRSIPRSQWVEFLEPAIGDLHAQGIEFQTSRAIESPLRGPDLGLGLSRPWPPPQVLSRVRIGGRKGEIGELPPSLATSKCSACH